MLGAGIVGLYTTFELIERGIDPDTITIIAEHSPGDSASDYSSPTAAAYFTAVLSEKVLEMSKPSYYKLQEVQSTLGPKCGLAKYPITQVYDHEIDSEYLSKLAFFDDFESKKLNDLEFSIRYTSWAFNPTKFLRALFKYAQKKGVKFESEKVDDITKVDAQIVFNCTGNGAKTLKGIEDKDCYSVRGQSVMVSAPQIKECVTYNSKDIFTYVIKRPDSSRDEVCLGGINEISSDTTIIAEQTRDILERTSKLCPSLLDNKPIDYLKILQVTSGLKPARDSGPRVEKETIQGKTVIHNYGAGAAGFMIGLTMAQKAVGLL